HQCEEPDDELPFGSILGTMAPDRHPDLLGQLVTGLGVAELLGAVRAYAPRVPTDQLLERSGDALRRQKHQVVVGPGREVFALLREGNDVRGHRTRSVFARYLA